MIKIGLKRFFIIFDGVTAKYRLPNFYSPQYIDTSQCNWSNNIQMNFLL